MQTSNVHYAGIHMGMSIQHGHGHTHPIERDLLYGHPNVSKVIGLSINHHHHLHHRNEEHSGFVAQLKKVNILKYEFT